MKRFPALLLLCLIPCLCLGGGRKPADANIVARFAYELSALRQAGIIDDLNTWADIEAIPEEAQSRLLGPPSGRPNISDSFVLIPRDKRIPLGDGLLFLVSAEPVNLTKWYRDQVVEKGTAPAESKALLEEYDRLNPVDKLARWYITINAQGIIKRNEIDEEDFLRICRANNFSLPPASPYRTNLSKQIDQYLLAQREREGASTAETTLATKPAEITAAAPTSAPTSPTKQPANPVWWIVGLIILAACVVFVTRKKKPRA